MRVLILGCGYVGALLGRFLAEARHDVFGLRRSSEDDAELRQAGVHPLAGDITQPDDLAGLPGPFDWVVNTVSSSRGGLAEYRRVYLEGTRALLSWLTRAGVQKYVYTSSTSVYGQADGSQVDETCPTAPASDTGQILVETEHMLLEAARSGIPTVILRVAGIYGPGRGHLFQQYLRDEARITGRGERFLNMIHRDDVVSAIVSALERGVPGEIYNAADDEPVTELAFFTWLAEQLGKPLPSQADGTEVRTRKRAITNKRVSNTKLKNTLGCRLKFPTFRDGYGAEIRRLQQPQ